MSDIFTEFLLNIINSYWLMNISNVASLESIVHW